MGVLSMKFTAFLTAFFTAGILSFSQASTAEKSWYCESGDPGGGGPAVFVDEVKKGRFKIQIDYNRRDLDSAKRSSHFEYEGRPESVDSVKEFGMECYRMAFPGVSIESTVYFFLCEEDIPAMKLINFSRTAPEYELGCQ